MNKITVASRPATKVTVRENDTKVTSNGVRGVPGPKGDKGDQGEPGSDEAITAAVSAAVQDIVPDLAADVASSVVAVEIAAHVEDASPHPAYDDIPSLVLIFQNHLV